MIRDRGRRVSPLESVVFTTAATFAAGIFIAPRILVADAGRSAGIALVTLYVLAVVWATVLARSAAHLPNRAPGVTLVQRLPILGYPWLAAVAIAELVIASGGLAAYQDMITAVELPNFSILSVTVLFAVGAWTAARHRMQGLSRVVLVFFTFFTALVLLSLLLLLTRAEEMHTLLPTTHLSLSGIATADVDTLFLFSGLGTLALTLPYHVRSESGLPHIATGVAVTGALTLLAFVATVATIGPDFVLANTWPLVTALRTLVLRNFFLDRFGLVVVFSWSAITLCFLAIHVWAAGEAICQMVADERGRGWWTLGGMIIVVGVVVVGMGPVHEETIARSVEGPAALGLALGWLLVTMGLAWGRKLHAAPQ